MLSPLEFKQNFRIKMVHLWFGTVSLHYLSSFGELKEDNTEYIISFYHGFLGNLLYSLLFFVVYQELIHVFVIYLSLNYCILCLFCKDGNFVVSLNIAVREHLFSVIKIRNA